MAITQGLITEWPNHLRVAGITAFSYVDIATTQFQWLIRTYALHFLHRLLNEEQRDDFDHATDTDGEHGENQQNTQVTFNLVVLHADSRLITFLFSLLSRTRAQLGFTFDAYRLNADAALAYRHEDVVAHNQHTGEEEGTANCAHDIERMRRSDRLNE